MFVQDDVSKASSLAKVQKNPGTTSLAFDYIVIYTWSSKKNGGLAVATFPEVSCCSPTLSRTPALLVGKDGCASWQHWGCQSQDSNQDCIKRWKNEKCWKSKWRRIMWLKNIETLHESSRRKSPVPIHLEGSRVRVPECPSWYNELKLPCSISWNLTIV